MRKSRLLVPAVLVAATAVVGGSARASADSGYPRVTANTNVAQNAKSPVRDLQTANIAVDPSDPNHIAVIGGDWRAGSCFLYVSTDGGASFAVGKQSPLPPQFDTCAPNGATNPWGIGFDKAGNILVATLVANRPSTASASGSVILAKTTDNGNTWSTTFVQNNRQTNPPLGVGQVFLVSDIKNNRIYVGYQQRNVPVSGYNGGTQRRALIAVSTDDGASFSPGVDIEGDSSNTLSIGGPWPALGPDGTLYAYYSQSAAPKTASPVFTSQTPNLEVAKSTDGGKTYTSATIMPISKEPQFFGYSNFAVAPYKGGTAMVLEFEALAQGSTASQNQVRDIYTISSTDGGNTWGSPTRVTDDDINTDLGSKFTPGISA
ncbi:MAG: exo-alpha-sialidase, partial [Candidatus Dormibacteraeota bacterium]|nr:exo-alpha-sialidase [Candidatus Dormibacteraeota bacterium]